MESETLTPHQVEALLERIYKVPIMESLSMNIIGLEEGICIATVPRQAKWDGIYQTFHGGILGTIADSITCFAILTKLGAEANVATTDFNIRFLRPCHTDVTCTARVIRAGRTLSLAEAEITNEEGQIVALAQVSYMSIKPSS
jgi:uncharacterized protein (TIGR00369 family)